jgi:hypothetical protein
MIYKQWQLFGYKKLKRYSDSDLPAFKYQIGQDLIPNLLNIHVLSIVHKTSINPP